MDCKKWNSLFSDSRMSSWDIQKNTKNLLEIMCAYQDDKIKIEYIKIVFLLTSNYELLT